MKAIVCRELGPPERLRYEDVPDPVPRPNEVCIRVRAAGVNFPDTLIIQGRYQLRAEPPFIPGAEVAGEVLAVGERIRHLRAGDRVAALPSVGGYAEQVCAPGDAVIALPRDLDFETAAAFPLAYGTTVHALVQRGRLVAGETLLVLGAGGGVGLAAVQIGKLLGARVIAAAGSAEKLALAQHYGADAVINYRHESLKDAVKGLTDGKGADVIYDPVGGELAQECLSCINWNGRYLIIGFAAGEIPQLPANRLLLKGASAVGVFWGAFVGREPQQNFENVERLLGWITSGELRAHISRSYPLAEAAQALSDMADRRVTGKIVLLP